MTQMTIDRIIHKWITISLYNEIPPSSENKWTLATGTNRKEFPKHNAVGGIKQTAIFSMIPFISSSKFCKAIYMQSISKENRE